MYDLTADTVLSSVLSCAPPAAGTEIRVRCNGHRLTVDVAAGGRLDLHATRPAGGRWSEGSSAYVVGQPAVVAPMTLGDMTVRPYTGGAVAKNAATGRSAEVLNLWSDVVFQGPGDVHVSMGPTHKGTKPYPEPAVTAHWVKFEGMGILTPGPIASGKYPLHLHLMEDGSRGSTILGCVAVGCQNHAFVAHGSSGVTISECAAYDTIDAPFWWDPQAQPPTNDHLYDRCLALLVKPRPILAPEHSFDGGYRLTGFRLSGGFDWHLGAAGVDSTNIACVGCHAAVVLGTVQGSGFLWPEADSGLWRFQDCVAHNVGFAGMFVWQNDGKPHNIDRFTAWSCAAGIEHGAYVNRFLYTDCLTADCSKAGLALHAMSGSAGPTSRDMRFLRHRHLGTGTPLRLEKPSVHGAPTTIEAANYDASKVTIDPQTAVPDGMPNTVANRLRFVG